MKYRKTMRKINELKVDSLEQLPLKKNFQDTKKKKILKFL